MVCMLRRHLSIQLWRRWLLAPRRGCLRCGSRLSRWMSRLGLCEFVGLGLPPRGLVRALGSLRIHRLQCTRRRSLCFW